MSETVLDVLMGVLIVTMLSYVIATWVDKSRRRHPTQVSRQLDHLEPTAEQRKLAREIGRLYQAFREQGFTDDQARWLMGEAFRQQGGGK